MSLTTNVFIRKVIKVLIFIRGPTIKYVRPNRGTLFSVNIHVTDKKNYNRYNLQIRTNVINSKAMTTSTITLSHNYTIHTTCNTLRIRRKDFLSMHLLEIKMKFEKRSPSPVNELHEPLHTFSGIKVYYRTWMNVSLNSIQIHGFQIVALWQFRHVCEYRLKIKILSIL